MTMDSLLAERKDVQIAVIDQIRNYPKFVELENNARIIRQYNFV